MALIDEFCDNDFKNPDCPDCGCEMRYSFMRSEYMCPECEKIFDANDESIYNYDPDEPPPCCQMCDGPWPDCISGCDMYDD